MWASTVVSLLIIFVNLQNAEITTDALTGLFNRGQLMPYLEKKTRRRDGVKSLFAVLMDLNDFKQINDRFGHLAGDEALRRAADVLRQGCGREDFLARYGGDEFVLVAEREAASDVDALVERIRGLMALRNDRDGKPYELSISVGCARWEDGYSGVDEFVGAADARMYDDKHRWKEARAG